MRFQKFSFGSIRIDGTNAEAGREILEPHLSDRLMARPTMLDAAREAVALAAAANGERAG